MRKINLDRLGKFALYLRGIGKLKCEKFYESLEPEPLELEEDEDIEIHEKELSPPILFMPIMELPIIFPQQWYYDEEYMPVFKEDPQGCTINSVILFFGINMTAFHHLLSPGLQNPTYGSRQLGANPSPRDLSDHLLDFIDTIRHIQGIKGVDPKIFIN